MVLELVATGEIQKLDIGDAKIIKDDEGDELIYISKGKNGDERSIPIDGMKPRQLTEFIMPTPLIIMFSIKL